jgi:hypothetical protein
MSHDTSPPNAAGIRDYRVLACDRIGARHTRIEPVLPARPGAGRSPRLLEDSDYLTLNGSRP